MHRRSEESLKEMGLQTPKEQHLPPPIKEKHPTPILRQFPELGVGKVASTLPPDVHHTSSVDTENSVPPAPSCVTLGKLFSPCASVSSDIEMKMDGCAASEKAEYSSLL